MSVHTVLVVDDTPDNRDMLRRRLERHGYAVTTAVDGLDALQKVADAPPDLILLDVMMPRLDGLETVRRLKGDPSLPFIPVILLTAKTSPEEVVEGLDAGADDYVTKPIDFPTLLARVRAMARIKGLQDTIRRQAETLEGQARELSAFNQTLGARVDAQVAEIERRARLDRFLPRQVVDAVLASASAETLLATQRRDVTVLFCDLRGFTAFAEMAEPDEVMELLRDYHAVVGACVDRREGMLDRFLGDGVLILFNAPGDSAAPEQGALLLAGDLTRDLSRMGDKWVGRGYDLGFGIGIAAGPATVGCIGFEGRVEYTVIGSVANLASRLCDAAAHGQTLMSASVARAAGGKIPVQPAGAYALKGFEREVAVFELVTAP